MKLSDDTTKLVPALIAARAQMVQPKMDATAGKGSYSYEYATLQANIAAVDNAIKGTGLDWRQDVTSDPVAHTVSVTTLIEEKSGQYIQFGPLTMPVEKPTAQGYGSAITYARRYSLTAAMGIAADSDDDGQAAAGQNNSNQQQKYTQQPAKDYQKPKETIEEAIQHKVTEYAKLVQAKPVEMYKQIITKLKLPNKPASALTRNEAGEIYRWIDRQVAEINRTASNDNGSH